MTSSIRLKGMAVILIRPPPLPIFIVLVELCRKLFFTDDRLLFSVISEFCTSPDGLNCIMIEDADFILGIGLQQQQQRDKNSSRNLIRNLSKGEKTDT
ncbi:unnamed protein product [Rotaria socialis]|uniref:Uncharacterized protein n=1 Tax=Rotaria socialis TaxID=392032 RepID=A0A821WRZ9_9BILA|nr:unnamed protein product [Rotaria socialis]